MTNEEIIDVLFYNGHKTLETMLMEMALCKEQQIRELLHECFYDNPNTVWQICSDSFKYETFDEFVEQFIEKLKDY